MPLAHARIHTAAPAPPFASRARFEAAYARWLPRIYTFAARRLASRAQAEAVARLVLVRVVESGLLLAGDEAAPEILALAKREVARATRP
jgi:DNA-directed RNA polymerase specialized sigma24 family protein